MKALTVKQPWADAIAYGSKRVENRSWSPPNSAIGSRILIHAGASYDPMGRFTIRDRESLDSWPNVRGAVLATAVLAGAHLDHGSCCRDWGNPHEWHWQLVHIRPLHQPVPCPGAQRLWSPPPAVQHAVAAQTHPLDSSL